MPTEIERKFLVNADDYKELSEPLFYQQGYLCQNDKSVIRVRIAGDKGFLTIKEESTGMSRLEFEYEIPPEDARNLLDKLCKHPIIIKHRYKIPFNELVWEVDEFHGENEGLVVAEVELLFEEQSFEKPLWVGEEVTGISKYYNVNLSKKPFSEW